MDTTTQEKVDPQPTTLVRTRSPVSITNSSTTPSEKPKETNVTPTEDDSGILTGLKLVLVFVGFLLSILLVSLDQTIVATALPTIASEFKALDQLPWVITIYLLTEAGLMMTYGQILTIASVKWTYIFAIALFEIGSLVCGVAPNIEGLIAGRAIQGLGAGGLFISTLTSIAQVTRLEDRAVLLGTFGAVFAVASIAGPLLGGVFTDKATWRWCFYINLPFGVLSIGAILIWLPYKPPTTPPGQEGWTLKQKWLNLDWIGSLLAFATITPLLIALQWGGQSKPWSDKGVIAGLVVFGVMLPIFIAWEWYMGERSMMPLRMWLNRTNVGASMMMFFLMNIFISFTFYLPYFYQAKGETATESGLSILPFMFAAVSGTGVSGYLITRYGRYWPFMIIGCAICAVGSGLLFTIDYYTPNSKIIGYQILAGFGGGLAFQQPVLAVQAEYADEPTIIPQATSLVTFMQLVGGAVGVAVTSNIFGNKLIKNLTAPDSPVAALLPYEALKQVKMSVLAIFHLPQELQLPVIQAYCKALDYAFIVGVPAAGLALLFALMVRNWNVKERAVAGGVHVA